MTSSGPSTYAAALQEWGKLRRDPNVPALSRKDLSELSQQRIRASLSDRALHIHKRTTNQQPGTVLYLAYGSNLCAETFQGRRGIRPLAAINVVVPELVMTFDLAGIPYTEPCFASTKYRHASTPPTSTASEDTPLIFTTNTFNYDYHKTRWLQGLVGVVYEVTLADFAHILATEGGGASYQNVLVDCYPLPSGTQHVPKQPSSPPFKAHTLLSPVCHPREDPSCTSRKYSRPDPNYAQPSARYLKLIIDGADEHAFPADYKAYLRQLRPYTITSRRQRLGGILFQAFWLPIVTAMFVFSSMFADDKGRIPRWLLVIVEAVFNGAWLSYDDFFHGVFGDGERTQYEDECEKKVG